MGLKAFSRNGFILPVTILLILGVTAIAVGTLFNSSMEKTTGLNYKNKIRAFNAADGMMTLLAQEVLNGNQNKYLDSTDYGKIYGDVWTGLSGATVQDLKTRIASQPSPNYRDSSYYLGSNWTMTDYGVRWKGWLLPPISGSYTFVVMANDAGSFYLSTDDSATGLPTTPTCSVATFINTWPTTGSAISQSVQLLAGQRYYFEFYHKQGSGGDIGMVGWTGPEWLVGKPIAKYHLSRFRTRNNFSGIDTLDGVPIRYRVSAIGLDRYGLFTEGIIPRPGMASDTAYRSPLNQILSVKGSAIRPPDTTWMRVIYYDFEYCKVNNNTWNPVNPEFEIGLSSAGTSPWNGVEVNAVKTDMVQRKQFTWTDTNASYFGLASIPKPKLGTSPFVNCGVAYWFRPYRPMGNRSVRYRTSPDMRSTCTDDGTANSNWYTAAHDTSFKNKVFFDSVAFVRNPATGEYTFENTDFFPLTNSTPPTSPPLSGLILASGQSAGGAYTTGGSYRSSGQFRNYGFCAEMHTKFEHFAGAKFDFFGDDDVWVFINDSLVIDIGNVKASAPASVVMDDIPNLRYGETYRMDLFFCERHSPGSVVRMVTNLPVARPQGTPVINWKRDYGSLD